MHQTEKMFKMEISSGVSKSWFFIELERKYSFYKVIIYEKFDKEVDAFGAFKIWAPKLADYILDNFDFEEFLQFGENDEGWTKEQRVDYVTKNIKNIVDRLKKLSDDAYYGYAILKEEDFQNKTLLAILTLAPSCIFKRILAKFPSCCEEERCEHHDQGDYLYDKIDND